MSLNCLFIYFGVGLYTLQQKVSTYYPFLCPYPLANAYHAFDLKESYFLKIKYASGTVWNCGVGETGGSRI